ncbi:murein L,D-transpeptidase catalytic domain family protein [Gammaproteobacteria bacterium]|nr:murein L,D-transpeptidase catalytic domain family protein [Gammaproteobacteria bacterium]
MQLNILTKIISKSFLCVICIVFICILSGWGPLNWLLFKKIATPKGSEQWVDSEIKNIQIQAKNINTKVLKLSLIAYLNAKEKGIPQKDLLTIIDYSKPSVKKRLWVIDLKTNKVLFNTWVSHGRNSGKGKAYSFSNKPGSLKSSIGVFKTMQTPYIGHNGYSLRLVGLENGFNDKALKRYIVFHGAWYAHPDMIKKHGFLGRSFGCPAVSIATVKPLINTIKDNSLVVVYYPDRKWINNSKFLAAR